MKHLSMPPKIGDSNMPARSASLSPTLFENYTTAVYREVSRLNATIDSTHPVYAAEHHEQV